MSFGRYNPAAQQERRAAEREANMRALMVPSRTLHRATMGVRAGPVVAVPKREYIRSPKLLAAVRKLPCQITGRTNGVEASHSNWPQHGKAGAIKADDNRIAAIHRSMHRDLDQGHTLGAEEKQEIWWQAHIKTVRALLAAGTWPKGVPVPQLEDFWK